MIVKTAARYPGSDVDLLADFPPGLSLFGLGRLAAGRGANDGAAG
jgi:hypothetical protein